MNGLTINGTTCVWQGRITSSTIAERKSREFIQKILTVVFLTIIVVSFGLFLFRLFFFLEPSDLLRLKFWASPNSSLASFWLAVIVCQILFFRFSALMFQPKRLPHLEDEKRERPPVKPLVEGEEGTAVSIFDFFDLRARRVLEEAYETAKKFRSREILPLHLFVGALSSGDAAQLFGRLGLSFQQIKDALVRRLSAQTTSASGPVWETAAEGTLLNAAAVAVEHDRPHVAPLEIIFSSYERDPFLQELLDSQNVERQAMENVIHWIRISDELARRAKTFARAAAHKPKGAMNRAYTALATPFLDAVSDDLTRQAAFGRLPILIGRENEMNAILRAIEGGRQSVVLIGEPGIGKEGIIYGLAERMVEERVPPLLQDKRLIRLSLSHLVGGAAPHEQEGRLIQVLQEVAAAGNIILVIQDVDQMIGGGLDLASTLAAELDRHYTFLVATITPDVWVNKLEGTALGERLIQIPVSEPEINDAILVLESKIPLFEYQHHVLFTYPAVAALVNLSHRYLHDRRLPEAAIEAAQEVALSVRQSRGERSSVTVEDVAVILSEKTHVPLTVVQTEERQTLLAMEERLHNRVIGQDEAIRAVAAALRRARTELRSSDRPIANFLFLGPTGVGKTELAKTVSEVYFGSEDAMLRFDMSEFQGDDAVTRLIGPAGGHGLLTEAVRQKPFALLLLDEFEKAHSEALNLFLQVMEDGRLTDGSGRLIDFTNVILVATSNAAAAEIQDAVRAGTQLEEIRDRLLTTNLRAAYRPELINRFDGVILFKPLSMDEIVQITYLLLDKVRQRLQVKGINFEPEDAVVYELAKKGYDPQFGARPLRRVIQETVDNAIANLVLKGEVGRRDTIILKSGGRVEVRKAEKL